jgi:hypothetical protein
VGKSSHLIFRLDTSQVLTATTRALISQGGKWAQNTADMGQEANYTLVLVRRFYLTTSANERLDNREHLASHEPAGIHLEPNYDRGNSKHPDNAELKEGGGGGSI